MTMRFLEDRASWWCESGAIVRLAVPLTLTHLAHMAIMLTDVVMMGRIGTETIAAGSLARDFYWVMMAFAIGVLTGATPVMAQHLGARRFRAIRPAARNAAWLCVPLAIPIMITGWHASPILGALGQDPAIAAMSEAYLRAMVWGLLPFLWFVVLSELLTAHVRPRSVLVVTVHAIALNAVLDYAFMFGKLGAPDLGLVGAGVASAIVEWAMFAALLAFVLVDRRLRRYRLLGYFWRLDRAVMGEIARLGGPIAVTEIAEMGLFFVTTLMMGVISTEILAAHAVTAQCYGIVFMIPVGLAQAGAVRVGHAAGARDPVAAARSGWTAIALSGMAVMVPVLAFWFAGREIASLILDAGDPQNSAIFGLAASLLSVAAVFMVSDAVQITARGVLQGLKDTTIPMAFSLVTSWGMGLPCAAAFGFWLGWGGEGIWAGLAVAVSAASVLLVIRFRRRIEVYARTVEKERQNR